MDMTAHHVVPPVQGTAARGPVPSTDVEAWRLRRLVDAGFPLRLALELAARILAPIDDTDGRP